jgi:hypothetical protein
LPALEPGDGEKPKTNIRRIGAQIAQFFHPPDSPAFTR